MKRFLNHISKTISHLIYPNLCEGCGTEVISQNILCTKCFTELAYTNYTLNNKNPIASIFYGRAKIEAATTALYFTKNGLVQHLITQLKYKNNQEVGIYLGELLGNILKKEESINSIDAIIPLPLNAKREFKRGYNQAALIASGIENVTNKPVIEHAVERIKNTSTQTHENRINRWQHMEDVFELTNPQLIKGKHILLVDDVITTGATLEACAHAILAENSCKVSIATIAQTL